MSARQAALGYTLTRDAVHLGAADDRVHDIVPLAIVEGVDVGHSMVQRLRGVGEIKLRLDRAGGRTEARDPVDASAAAMPLVQQLRELAALHDAGALTDAEFQCLKAKLIDP